MAAVDGQYTCVGTFGRVCLSDKQGVCLSKQKFCRETGFAGTNFLCGCAIVFPRGGYRRHVAAGRRSHLERLASKDPMNVIVVVINYVFSKLFIFRRPQ